MAAQSLAHAALDAIALVGLAEHFAHGEADARQPERRRRRRQFATCGARNQLMEADWRLRPAA